MSPDTVLRTLAPAKLNLTLEVVGKRADGYHDLVSVVQTVDLADTVMIAPAPKRQIRFLDAHGQPLALPFENETVARAWDALAERADVGGGVGGGATVTVVKRIPAAAGLGGGSSDAAAFLRLARRWWTLDLSNAQLSDIGAEVGSDVPLFVHGGTLVLEGRGERTSRPAAAQQMSGDWAALIYTPEIPLPAQKTAAMFQALQPRHFSSGARGHALLERLAETGRMSPDDLVNAFDPVAGDVLPGVQVARRHLSALSGLRPLLAGAGPSLFVLGDEDALAQAAERLEWAGEGRVFLVRPLPASAATRLETVRGSLPSGKAARE